MQTPRGQSPLGIFKEYQGYSREVMIEYRVREATCFLMGSLQSFFQTERGCYIHFTNEDTVYENLKCLPSITETLSLQSTD